jgi:hypothetical protein
VNPPDNNEWTDGAFCMAGSELYKLMTSTGVVDNTRAVNSSMTTPNATKVLFCGSNRRIEIPGDARALEVYNMKGRLLYNRFFNRTMPSQTAILPEHFLDQGIVVVRFKAW